MNCLVPAPVQAEVVGNGVFLEANPFRVGSLRYIEGVPEGAPLTEYAAAALRALPRSYHDHLHLWVGENPVARENWARVRPKPGADVFARVRPQGKGGKNILRAVIMIAVIAVAVYFLGPAAFAAGGWLGLSLGASAAAAASAAAIAAVTLVATLSLNALIPPPGLSGQVDNKDPRYSLTGTQNRYAPYAPIPRLFGKVKLFPLVAGRPFTENVGKHQYLRMLLLVGWGPIKVSDIRIGNSPISNFRNVQVEIHEGGPDGWPGNRKITLYNRRVTEQDLSFELAQNVAAPVQTTDFNTVEIECDILFPFGIIEYEDDGDRDSRTVQHRFEYRAVGAGTWINAPLIDDDEIRVRANGVMESTGKTPESVRHTARWKVPEGQYEVRVTRLTHIGAQPAPSGDNEIDNSYWTNLRCFTTDDAVTQEGLCLIAIRMQASEQLNGVPSTISCVAESYNQVYSASQTTEGPELVTNGQGNAVTGWTELNAGRSSLTSVGGMLRITRPPSVADSQAWYQDIAVTAGQTYRLRGKMYPNEGNKCRLVLVNGSTTNYDYSVSSEVNATFVAAGASVRIRLEAFDGTNWITADNYAEFDNVSLKLQQASQAGWVYQLTQNPAWHFADVLKRRGPDVFLPDSRIDITTISAWAAACAAAPPSGTDTARWTFNGVLEGGSVFDGLRQIAAIGRAQYTLKDGKHSVVRDTEQATPVQHITPRNSWGYTGSRFFADLPHALRVEFQNKDKEYRVDELVVYADGYDENTAEKYEVMSLLGATSSDLVFREARYHLAVGVLRPEEHRVNMDIENLRCTLGDRVQLSHDVISVGKGWGRVIGLITDGSDTVGFQLDEKVEFEAGETYQLRVRHSDGVTSIRAVTATEVGSTDTLYCLAEPTTGGPAAGDVFMFGLSGIESLPALVKRIEPGDDLSATLTLIPYDPAVHTADTGAIPPFNSYLEGDFDSTAPGVPGVVLRSGPSTILTQQDGTVVNRIAVDITAPASSRVPVVGYEVRYRLNGDGDWETVGGLWPASTATVWVSPVKVGAVYEVSARAKGANGLYSAWVQPADHTAAGNSVAPQLPTAITVAAKPDHNEIRWTNPVSIDFKHVEIWRDSDSGFTGAVRIGTSINGKFDDYAVEPGDRWYYWLKSVGTGGTSAEVSAGNALTPEPIFGGGGGDNHVYDPGFIFDGWGAGGFWTINTP